MFPVLIPKIHGFRITMGGNTIFHAPRVCFDAWLLWHAMHGPQSRSALAGTSPCTGSSAAPAAALRSLPRPPQPPRPSQPRLLRPACHHHCHRRWRRGRPGQPARSSASASRRGPRATSDNHSAASPAHRPLQARALHTGVLALRTRRSEMIASRGVDARHSRPILTLVTSIMFCQTAPR